jgi:putative methyltransferase (TIGR04325 family)
MKLKACIKNKFLNRAQNKSPNNIYDTFDDALADSDTYEDQGVIGTVSIKTEALRNALLIDKDRTVKDRQIVQNMFILSYVFPHRPLNVLEIGGACGAMYFELNHLLPLRIKSWYIAETPAMVVAADKLFKEDKLCFIKSDEAISKIVNLDLLMAQGVLQYLKEPLQKFEDLLNFGFKYVYITRTVVGTGIDRQIITKQVVDLSAHGPGPVPIKFIDRKSSQPLTIVPFESLLSRISDSHNIVFFFDEGEGLLQIGSQTVVKTKTIGFLLENKN